jgi:hypothetical protein
MRKKGKKKRVSGEGGQGGPHKNRARNNTQHHILKSSANQQTGLFRPKQLRSWMTCGSLCSVRSRSGG